MDERRHTEPGAFAAEPVSPFGNRAPKLDLDEIQQPLTSQIVTHSDSRPQDIYCGRSFEDVQSTRLPNTNAEQYTNRATALHKASRAQTAKRKEYQGMLCDYRKCLQHENLMRKDHLREHYREYHFEDLIKRGRSKLGKVKTETAEEFLASRVNSLSLRWWRCSKCLYRVQVNLNGYTCPICKTKCEPERLKYREIARNANESISDASKTQLGSLTGSPEANYVTGCGQCENTWLPDKDDESLWTSCPRCQLGVEQTLRF
jgi:rubrerythrin